MYTTLEALPTEARIQLDEEIEASGPDAAELIQARLRKSGYRIAPDVIEQRAAVLVTWSYEFARMQRELRQSGKYWPGSEERLLCQTVEIGWAVVHAALMFELSDPAERNAIKLTDRPSLMRAIQETVREIGLGTNPAVTERAMTDVFLKVGWASYKLSHGIRSIREPAGDDDIVG